MSNQVTKALSTGEHARNHSGGYDVAPEVARSYELSEADHNLDAWHNAFDPQPIAATAMSSQVESQPHATTNGQFANIMQAEVDGGVFDADYINAISGNQLGADMPADTPRPTPVEAQPNFQPYQGV